MNKFTLPLMGIVILCLTGQVQAGGLYLYEMGTSDIGFAGAGSAARAADASTIYSNPAGLSRLDGRQVVIGAQALYGNFNYQLNQGNSPGNVVGWQPGGSIFYSQELDDSYSFGIGVYSNAGLSLDFGDTWKGKPLLDEASLIFTTIQPTLAWEFSDKLSFGAGATLTQGRVKISSANTRENNRLVDESDIDYALGARLGLMYEFSSNTRFGVAWSSQQTYNFDINRRIVSPVTQNVLLIEQAHMRLPQHLMFSVWHDLNARLAVTGNLGWQQWSRFADNYVSSSIKTVNSSLQLQDTWHTALGMQYRVTNFWSLNGGIAYDSSWNKSDSKGSLNWPSSQAWRFATGTEYILSDVSVIGMAIEYLKGSTLKDQSAVMGGEYSSPYMIFLSAQYTYKF